MSESLEFKAFLLDSRKNVMEKIRVYERQCSFHGRLLKYGETYDVEVGGFRLSVGLIGTSVLCVVIVFAVTATRCSSGRRRNDYKQNIPA